MSMTKTTDMTVGSPFKHIIKFVGPTLLGYLFQQFYSMVDTIVVGQYLGKDALAAVGSTGSINFMIIGFCMGTCNGLAIPIAQRFGAKDYKSLRKYLANGIWTAIFFAIIMTTAVCLLCRNILEWMHTPSNIIDDAYSYIFIIFLGIPATYLYNLTSAILRSIGDSKSPVYFLLISSLLNIVLDLILVTPMGVAGPAIATVISQMVSCILCLIYMAKKFEILRFSRSEATVDMHCISILCKMGLPMGLQYSITAIGSIILQTSVNGLGSDAVAAMTAATRLGGFFCCPFDALGTTSATYGGQNVGAGKLDRIGQGLKSCIAIGFCYSILAFIVLFFFGDDLALLFLEKSEGEILDNAHLSLLWSSATYFLLALVNIIRFLIQGLGFSSLAILAGVFEMFARATVGFFLVPAIGYVGACMASPLAWLAADIFLIPAYFHVMKTLKNRRLQHFEEDELPQQA